VRFHESSKFFGPNPKPFHGDHGTLSTTLKELIEINQSFALPVLDDEFNLEERRILAAKLALHLSIFGCWRHFSVPWDGESIYFLQSAQGSVDKGSPYITWRIKPCSPSLALCDGGKTDAKKDCNDSQDGLSEVGYIANIAESFASFAKLLLEIEFGEIPKTKYSLNNDSMGMSLRKYVNALQKTYAITHGGYLHAIDACLRFHQAYEEARFYQALSQRVGTPEKAEETYRRLVRSEIASPILIDLLRDEMASSERARLGTTEAEEGRSLDEMEFDFVDDDDVPRYPDTIAGPSPSSAAHFLTSLGQSLIPQQPWKRWLTPSSESSSYGTWLTPKLPFTNNSSSDSPPI
jgi:hypothetical protein